jgi:hypothetical protein
VPEFSVLWTPFVFHAQLTWGDVVIIAYAVGVAIYLASPFVGGWWLGVRGGARQVWAGYRQRGSWKF